MWLVHPFPVMGENGVCDSKSSSNSTVVPSALASPQSKRMGSHLSSLSKLMFSGELMTSV